MRRLAESELISLEKAAAAAKPQEAAEEGRNGRRRRRAAPTNLVEQDPSPRPLQKRRGSNVSQPAAWDSIPVGHQTFWKLNRPECLCNIFKLHATAMPKLFKSLQPSESPLDHATSFIFQSWRAAFRLPHINPSCCIGCLSM